MTAHFPPLLDELPPTPEAYSRSGPPQVEHDGLTLLGSHAAAFFAVESRERGTSTWQLRPHNEHRGGRAFTNHVERVKNAPGLEHRGGLIFRVAEAAVTCCTELAGMNEDVEYRVSQIKLVKTITPIWPYAQAASPPTSQDPASGAYAEAARRVGAEVEALGFPALAAELVWMARLRQDAEARASAGALLRAA